MASISLCMIVRDEEELLPRCLRSVRDVVDEMIVVDTGSSDRTVAVARELGAAVSDLPWEDDFAAARNASLRRATGDWVLFLDADETLDADAAADLRRKTRSARLGGLWVPVVSALDDERSAESLQVRVFRRNDAVRFRYRIHEQILPTLERHVATERLGLDFLRGCILHDGYRDAIVERKGKVQRNLALFEKQLEETPDDAYVLYMFADMLRRHHLDEDRAGALLERGYRTLLELADTRRRDLTFGGELCASLADWLEQRGRHDAAARVVTTGLEHCRRTPHLLLVAGRQALHRSDCQAAARHFRDVIGQRGSPRFVPIAFPLVEAAARSGLVHALRSAGQHQDALEEARAHLAGAPLNDSAISDLAELELEIGDARRLVHDLMTRLKRHPTCAMSWLAGGRALAALGLLEKAVPWLLRCAELDRHRGPALSLAGQALVLLGLREDAADAFARGLPDTACQAGVLALSLAYGVPVEESGVDLESAGVLRALSQLIEVWEQADEDVVMPAFREACEIAPDSRLAGLARRTASST